MRPLPDIEMVLAEAIPALRRFVDTAPLDPANVHGQLSERVALMGYLDDLQTLIGEPTIVHCPDVCPECGGLPSAKGCADCGKGS